jgi:hypothetical protein
MAEAGGQEGERDGTEQGQGRDMRWAGERLGGAGEEQRGAEEGQSRGKRGAGEAGARDNQNVSGAMNSKLLGELHDPLPHPG